MNHPPSTGLLKSLQPDLLPHVFFCGENIPFDAGLVIYINSTNISPIMIINRLYETQNLLSLQLVSFLVGLRIYQHPCMPRSYKHGVRFAMLEYKFPLKEDFWLLSRIVCNKSFHEQSVGDGIPASSFITSFRSSLERRANCLIPCDR